MAKAKKMKFNDKKVDPPAGEVAVSKSTDMDDWKSKDDADLLRRAGEVLSDPDRMKKAHKHHKKNKAAFKSVDELIAHRNEKFGPKSEMEEEV